MSAIDDQGHVPNWVTFCPKTNKTHPIDQSCPHCPPRTPRSPCWLEQRYNDLKQREIVEFKNGPKCHKCEDHVKKCASADREAQEYRKSFDKLIACPTDEFRAWVINSIHRLNNDCMAGFGSLIDVLSVKVDKLETSARCSLGTQIDASSRSIQDDSEGRPK